MESIEKNGVTFTPEKVVNLDEIMARSKSDPEPAPTGDPDPDPAPAPTGDPDPDPEPAPAPAPTVDPDPEPAPAGGQEFSLDEISLKVGDEELTANQFLDRYESTKAELDEIKNDEFLGKFINFYKSGGNPAEYLEKATKDWGKVGDIDMLRMQFNEENSDLDEDVKEILFGRRLRELYGVNADGTFDDEDSADAKLGKQLMKRDASKVRQTRLDEQKNFVVKASESASQKQPAYDAEKAKAQYMADPELQDFLKTKSIKVGDSLAYEVKDPTQVIGMMADVNNFWKLFAKQDGSMDKEKIAKVFAYALDPKAYDDAILGLGKDAGAESYVREQKNVVIKKQAAPSKETDNSQVVVKGGKIVNPSDKDRFIKDSVVRRG